MHDSKLSADLFDLFPVSSYEKKVRLQRKTFCFCEENPENSVALHIQQ